MKIEREWFENTNSYKAFLYAVEVFSKLIEFQKKGYVFLGIDDEQFYIEIDGKNSNIGYQVGNCSTVIVGHTHGGENYDLIYTTKKEVNDFIKTIKAVKPEDLVRVDKLLVA